MPLPPSPYRQRKEKEDTSHFVERTQEFQPFNCYLSLETKIEKVNKNECVVDDVNIEVVLVGPYSRHYSKLCLDDDMSVEPSEIVEKCKVVEQESYILNFVLEKQQKSLPHCTVEWFTMHHPLLGSFIFVSLYK